MYVMSIMLKSEKASMQNICLDERTGTMMTRMDDLRDIHTGEDIRGDLPHRLRHRHAGPLPFLSLSPCVNVLEAMIKVHL